MPGGGGGGSGPSSTTTVRESAESRELARVTARISREMWDLYKTKGLPALERFTSDVEGYGSPARLATEAGLADTAVQQAYADERAGLMQALGRYGSRPGSGRFASALRSLALGEASDRAGARTGSRIGVLDRALGHRLNAINLWAGHPGQALSGLSAARGRGSTSTTQQRGGSDGTGELIGTVIGAVLPSIIGVSDRRLKTDIEKVGDLTESIGVYEFRFKGHEDGALYTGCMADEVLMEHPEFVIEDGGYLCVDYGGLIAKTMEAHDAQ